MNKKEIYEKILMVESYGYECVYIKTLKKWFEENKPEVDDKIVKNI